MILRSLVPRIFLSVVPATSCEVRKVSCQRFADRTAQVSRSLQRARLLYDHGSQERETPALGKVD